MKYFKGKNLANILIVTVLLGLGIAFIIMKMSSEGKTNKASESTSQQNTDGKKDAGGDLDVDKREALVAPSENMNFFITSVGSGKGADLGGLQGADAHCKALAEATGYDFLSNKKWRAYLSTTGEGSIDAKDRIGTGPWFNYKGVEIASDIKVLHADNNLNKETGLNEKGEITNGRGDTPNRHDILTGSQLDGSAFDTTKDTTCNNWTSSSGGSARLGHHDRTGGGDYPESWNSAHDSRGCSQEDLRGTGGDGLFYCFAD